MNETIEKLKAVRSMVVEVDKFGHKAMGDDGWQQARAMLSQATAVLCDLLLLETEFNGLNLVQHNAKKLDQISSILGFKPGGVDEVKAVQALQADYEKAVHERDEFKQVHDQLAQRHEEMSASWAHLEQRAVGAETLLRDFCKMMVELHEKKEPADGLPDLIRYGMSMERISPQRFYKDAEMSKTDNSTYTRRYDGGKEITEPIHVTVSERVQVEAFHKAFDVPVQTSPTELTPEMRATRARMTLEETLELIDALGCSVFINGLAVDHKVLTVQPSHKMNLANAAHENADLRVISHGTDLLLGVDQSVFNEVMRANMRKIGPDAKVKRRADGKILKPEGWQPADVAKVIEELKKK